MTKETHGIGSGLRSFGLLGTSQFFQILVGILRNKAAAVLIGSTGIGLTDLYNRAADLLTNSTNFGLSFSAVQRLSAAVERGDATAIEREVRLVRTWVLLTALLGTLVALLLIPLLVKETAGAGWGRTDALFLAPMVGLLTLTSGEAAILKSLRRLRRLAAVAAVGAVFTLGVSVLLYLWLGIRGVAPVLLLSTAGLAALHVYAAGRSHPYRVGFSSDILRGGRPLLRLGAAYILAGLAGSGAEMLVRAFLVHSGSLAVAGFYAAGFTLTVSYARLIFVAMDADFFPRLSAIHADRPQANRAVNAQIDVLVLLMAPFLLVFALCLPLIVRLLYTHEFLHAVPMVLPALFCMFFKAVYSPIAYLSLANADSTVYLALELIYDAVFAVAVVAGYHWGGLAGAGAGLSLAHGGDLLLLHAVYRRRYGFRFESATLRRSLVQGALLAAGIAAAGQDALWLRWGGGALCCMLSISCSVRLLKRETSLARRLGGLFRRRKEASDA